MKKIIKMLLLLLTFMNIKVVKAYEYIDERHSSGVNDMISEIYDSREIYEYLSGGREDDSEELLQGVSSDYYWWPIGSAEVNESGGKKYASDLPETTLITSPFGNRPDPFGSGATVFHSGLDISGGSGLGSVNIIAAKDGTVVTSTKNGTVCPSGSQISNCNGGYGNYVVIQHSDGNYTLYAHLYENSLTVNVGDTVIQGQVIGKMGSSGNSTGAHLHFEVREGQNAYSAAVDPLNYVDPDNPRPANASSQIVDYIAQWEGTTKIVGNDYMVENIGDGVRTVGGGVVLDYHAENFKAHGIDINNYPVGSKIPISIVDAIKNELINEDRSYIEKQLSQSGITLKPHQIDALISFKYNCGGGAILDFIKKYKQYGDTEALYENCFAQYVHVYDEVWEGLVRRRKSEWNLFHNGIYDNIN